MSTNRRLSTFLLLLTLLGLLLFTSAVRPTIHIAHTKAENVAPQVDAGSDQTTMAGESVQFNGSFFDPDTADTHQIRWDFGDGRQRWGTLSPTHTYPRSGQYTVTLTITDSEAASSTDSLLVDVLNRPPKLSNITINPREIKEGDSFILSGMMSDTASDDSYSLEISWGDGLTATRNYPAGTLSFSFYHVCIDDKPSGTPSDSVTLNLKLTDDEGAFSTATAEITVHNVAPSVTIAADKLVPPGKQLDLTAVVSDPGSADTFSISWDLGDGSPAQTGTAVAHTFNSAGTYTVTATVTDDDGGIGQDEIEVDVIAINHLPVIVKQ